MIPIAGKKIHDDFQTLEISFLRNVWIFSMIIISRICLNIDSISIL